MRGQRRRAIALPPAVNSGQVGGGLLERGYGHGRFVGCVVRLCAADRRRGARYECLPPLEGSQFERGSEILPRRDQHVERDAIGRLISRAADQRRPVGEGKAAETGGNGDERDGQGRHPLR